MPTRNVNLTNELDEFVHAKIKSGRYENASEVVRTALRTLEREEQRHEAKLAALRTAVDEGDGPCRAAGARRRGFSGLFEGSSTKNTRLARPRRSMRMEPIHSFP